MRLSTIRMRPSTIRMRLSTIRMRPSTIRVRRERLQVSYSRDTFPSMIGKNFTVRLSPAEAELVEQIAADRGASSADVLRDAIRLYFRGEASKLRGPDEGYAAARALAGQLAHELLKEAQERLPRDHDAAIAWLAKRRTGTRTR